MKKTIILLFVLMFVFSLSASVARAGGGQNQGSIGQGQTVEGHLCQGTAADCVWDR